MFTRIKRAILPVVVLIAGVGGFALLQATKPVPENNTEPPRPTAVHAATATSASTQLTVATQGEVRARVEAEVVAQISGRIVEVSPEFIEGGRVVPGEPLLAIEDSDYRTQVQEAESRLASAKVELEQALADADVAKKQLAGQKNPSPLALKKPQVARAEAMVAAATANLATANTNLERTRVVLPFEGRIAETYVDLGQFVTAGKVIAKAFATDKVEVRLPLNDGQLAALGVPIGFSAVEGSGLPVSLSAVVGGDIHSWQGSIRRLDASLDPQTRTVYATAEVLDPYNVTQPGDMPLAVGLFVEAQISGRIVDRAVQIPTDGLRAGNQVFVVKDGLLDVREVDVVYRNPQQAVLAGGLAGGERVVISAIRNPIPGMRLEVIGDRQTEGAADETLAD